MAVCLKRSTEHSEESLAAVQGFFAGQQSGHEASSLPLSMSSCTGWQNSVIPLGTALSGVAVCVCDGSGRILPPEIPGYLNIGSTKTPNTNIATGWRVEYGWDGVLTLLTAQVN